MKRQTMHISSFIGAMITIVVAIMNILTEWKTSISTLEFLHIAIIVISGFSIFIYENNSFSLYKSFHLFNLFFVGIAPVIQYNYNVGFWGQLPMNKTDYINASTIYLLAILVFNMTYAFRYKKLGIHHHPKVISFFTENGSIILTRKKIAAILFFSLLAFFAIFWMNNFSLSSLLVRGGEDKIFMSGTSKMQRLIISKFFQPMNMILFLFIFSFTKNKILKIFLFVLAVLSASPTGLSRFAAASLYIPLLLSFNFFRRRNIYVVSFISGLLILFPAMTIFRNYSGQFHLRAISASMFTGVDFDSYFIYATILKEDIVTYGRQLLGVIFFWVPRAVWYTKPIGSGQFIGESFRFSNTNIACNIFGEGYINGGFIGLFLFAVGLAYLYATVDKLYWTLCSRKKMFYATIIYTIAIAESFLMIRGDLLCSTAYLSGFVTSYLFVRKVVIAS